MSFIERVKKVLLERNREELERVEQSIKEITQMHSDEYESVQKLREEFEIASQEKSQVQKTILDKKELEDLKTIYDFVNNYPTIQKVLKKIKDIDLPQIDEDNIYFKNVYYKSEADLINATLRRRKELNEAVKKLNIEITEIINSEKQEQLTSEHSEPEKKGFFAKLFGGKKKDKKTFNNYRKTISEFKEKYNSFLIADFVEFEIIDKKTSSEIARQIHLLSTFKKRGGELYPEEEQFLEDIQPHELWGEIAKYYINILEIKHIIERFDDSFERYEILYADKPDLFDLANLSRIFAENNQKIVALKDRNKAATSKKKEVVQQSQTEREAKEKLRNLEEKRKKLKEKREEIIKAETLNALGFKNKENAVKKLSLESKDYLVISIPNTISKISELFENERELRVEVDGRTFLGMYSNEVAEARINTIESSETENSCLMIPIFGLRKEDIDSIKAEKIFLNKSILQLKNLLIMTPDGRDIDLEEAKVETQNYSSGTITEQVEKFFGEDYLKGSDGVSDYDIFKKIPNVSTREKKSKREAVKRCVLENVKRTVKSTDTILVNGKPYYLNKEDENEIIADSRKQSLDEKFLIKISDDIEEYLIEGNNEGIRIDQLYQKLLLEYMKVERKAKADYYDEEHTTVDIKHKKMSIKPVLPAKDEKIAKRYSRKSEDVAYKTMKLSALVNKFAHLADSKELQDKLYDVKLDLIERVIDLSKDNPQITLKRKFDDNKQVMSIILEIPGYNMIALHVMNKSNSLTHKSNKLEESGEDVLQTSAILMPGINKDFLNALKNMSERERLEAFINMDSATFSKLVLRMGYTSDKISDEYKKKEFLKEITSDKKIFELINENEDLERE